MSPTKRSATQQEPSVASRPIKRAKLGYTSSLKENDFAQPPSTAPPPSTASNPGSNYRVTEPSAKSPSSPLTIKIRASRQRVPISISTDPTRTPSPPAAKERKHTYNTDPTSRRAELAKVAAVQFIHDTPYAVHCRPCNKPHKLEARGTGYYAQNWTERHENTNEHKKKLKAWMAKGGHLIEQEDEPVQWKCIYWKKNFGESDEMEQRIVRYDDGLICEALLALKAGEPKPGYRVRAIVDLSCEADMVGFARKGKARGKGKASMSRT